MSEERSTTLKKCIKRYTTALPSTSVDSRLSSLSYNEIYKNWKNYPQKKFQQALELEVNYIKNTTINGARDPFARQGVKWKKIQKTQYIDNYSVGQYS